MDKRVKAAIATIGEDMWTTIEYTDAVFDEATGRWVSRAEVAELPFTAFAAQKKAEQVPGRLVVRRIPDVNAEKNQAAGQDTLFDVWRFHAFFTTTDAAILDTVAADKTHRGHAVIEQVHSDLKNSALAHLLSGVFHRQRRLAGARGHRVQPHPCRRQPDRPTDRQGDHRDDPPQADHGAGTGSDLSPPDHPAPTASLALGNRLDGTDRPSQRPAPSPMCTPTSTPTTASSSP